MYHARKLDVEAFARDVARQRERDTRPAPTATGTLTYEQVLQRFGWDDATYTTACAFGFPPIAGRGVSFDGDMAVDFLTHEVERWASELAAFVRATRLDG